MLLVGVGDDEIVDRPPAEIADHAVTLVDALLRGAAIARQRHPAGVGDDPVAIGLVPDDARQNRERDVVERAHAEARHDEIEEHVDAGAHFGDAVECARRKSRSASSRR